LSFYPDGWGATLIRRRKRRVGPTDKGEEDEGHNGEHHGVSGFKNAIKMPLWREKKMAKEDLSRSEEAEE